MSVLKQSDCAGSINLGIPDDYVDTFLPDFLISFNQEFPLVEVNVVCRESRELAQLLEKDSVDLAIMTRQRNAALAHERELRQEPAVWVTSKNHIVHEHDPVPMAMFGNDCIFRKWATQAFDKTNRHYRMAYSSQSLAGILAFVKAGLGVSVLAQSSVSNELRILTTDDSYPSLPGVSIVLARSPANTSITVDEMEKHIVKSFCQINQKAA